MLYMLDTILGEVKPNIVRYADMISKTIDADVIIIDTNYDLVAGTFRYYGLQNEISLNSQIAEVLVTKKPVIIKDKSESECCVKCKEFDECKMVGFIGVPIFLDDIAIGALALILPRHRISPLFQNIDETVEFLNNMSELLSDKINKVRENNTLNKKLTDRYNIMNLIQEGVVYTDNYGNINFCNSQFEEMFSLSADDKKKNICDIVPVDILKDTIRNKAEIKGQQIIIDNYKVNFYGRVYSKMYSYSQTDKGFLFSFSKLSNNGCFRITDMSFIPDFNNVCRLLGLDIETLYNKMKNGNLMLKGNDLLFNIQLAYAISEYYSDNTEFIRVDCAIMCAERLEKVLFSKSVGVAYITDAVVIIANWDEAADYIKEKLNNLLLSGSFKKQNAHFIFITGNDSSRNSFGLMTDNVVIVNDVSSDMNVFRLIIKNLLNFYKEKCEKSSLIITDDLVSQLGNKLKGKYLKEIEKTIGTLIYNYNGTIDIDSVGDNEIKAKEVKSVEDFERHKLEQMMEEGKSKTAMAKELGMSRATLYRKLETYNLN